MSAAVRTASCILCACVACRATRADDWPEWLGPLRDATSRETGWLKDWPASGPPLLWERKAGEGYSTPSVAGGKLVLFHRVRDDDVLECLDALTGKSLWSHGEPTEYADRYGYSGGPRAQPIVRRSGEKAFVYTLDQDGRLNALDLETGKKLWGRDLQGEFHLQANFFGVGAAPVLDGDLLFVNLGGTDMGTGMTFGVDRRTGEVAWKTPSDGGAYAAARVAEIDGAKHLFVFHRGGLSCLDPKDGREKWKFPWRSRTYESVNASTPIVAGDLLFFSSTYGMGGVALRVKKESYDLLWKDDLEKRDRSLETHWCTPIEEAGVLYAFSGRHENGCDLRAVELATGKVLWTWESYLGRGSLLRSDGCFIALGERGDLALLKLSAKGHEELRRVPGLLRYPSWTPPVLAGGLLYLRDEHRLLCLDLRVSTAEGKPGEKK